MVPRLFAPLFAALVALSAVLSPVEAAHSRASVSLTGAGSTFDYPFFNKAFDVYCKANSVCVNYQSIGSGAGIQQFIARTVDFGATDVPMDPTSELPAAVKAGGAVEEIPIALGGVSVAYNVPGVKTGLHLSGPIVANIYLGLITRWNDKAIRKLNPRVKLPNLQIVPVHRSDGSGTSYIFTDYLSKISDVWRGHVGTGKLPNWPTNAGVGGKGNEGVAGLVQQTPGAIGYVELAYVVQNHMKEAALQNASRQFVLPSQKTVAAAAAQFSHVSASHFSIVNARGKNAYPISGYSWALLYRNQGNHAKGSALVKVMTWLATSGQKYARNLDYVPLPKNVQKLAVTQIKAVKA